MEKKLNYPFAIAIDGPAASGKSSVGKKVAEKLGFVFLDTGIMYRAVTWKVLDQAIGVLDENQVGKIAQNIDIKILKPSQDDGRMQDIFVDGEDVTWLLRSAIINKNVSQVSRYAMVREAMTNQQRVIGKSVDVVMAGRDIGTVVLPNAKVKIYLEASAEERARRRFSEESKNGNSISYDEILENVLMRDEIDSSRDIAPLKPADDAYIINTDKKPIDQVVNEIMQVINEANK